MKNVTLGYKIITISILLLITISQVFSAETWSEGGRNILPDFSVGYIKSFKPDFENIIELSYEMVYRNIRQGLIKCTDDGVILESELYQDIKAGEIHVYAEGEINIRVFYAEIIHRDESKSFVKSWALSGDELTLSKHINLLAVQGINVNCAEVLDLEKEKAPAIRPGFINN